MSASNQDLPSLTRRLFPKVVLSLVVGGLFAWLSARGGVPLVPSREAFAFVEPWVVPVYAVLDFSKNRSGGRSRCPFVWQKAYNRFIPVGGDQTEHEGGREEWAATWSVKLRELDAAIRAQASRTGKGIPR